MAFDISIGVIPHKWQRYDTVGDYTFKNATSVPGLKFLDIKISDMDNEDYEFLVTIHELVEAYLTHKRGISEAAITKFDMAYEEARGPEDYSEPGDSPEAPYYKEHQEATSVERAVAEMLGIDWDVYGEAVNKLSV